MAPNMLEIPIMVTLNQIFLAIFNSTLIHLIACFNILSSTLLDTLYFTVSRKNSQFISYDRTSIGYRLIELIYQLPYFWQLVWMVRAEIKGNCVDGKYLVFESFRISSVQLTFLISISKLQISFIPLSNLRHSVLLPLSTFISCIIIIIIIILYDRYMTCMHFVST